MGASAGGEGGGGMPDPALLQGGLNMLTACGGPTALPAVLTILPDVMASMDNFTALQKSLDKGNSDFWGANEDLLTLLRCGL